MCSMRNDSNSNYIRSHCSNRSTMYTTSNERRCGDHSTRSSICDSSTKTNAGANDNRCVRDLMGAVSKATVLIAMIFSSVTTLRVALFVVGRPASIFVNGISNETLATLDATLTTQLSYSCVVIHRYGVAMSTSRNNSGVMTDVV